MVTRRGILKRVFLLGALCVSLTACNHLGSLRGPSTPNGSQRGSCELSEGAKRVPAWNRVSWWDKDGVWHVRYLRVVR